MGVLRNRWGAYGRGAGLVPRAATSKYDYADRPLSARAKRREEERKQRKKKGSGGKGSAGQAPGGPTE